MPTTVADYRGHNQTFLPVQEINLKAYAIIIETQIIWPDLWFELWLMLMTIRAQCKCVIVFAQLAGLDDAGRGLVEYETSDILWMLTVQLHVLCREACDGWGVGPWSVRHCLHMWVVGGVRPMRCQVCGAPWWKTSKRPGTRVSLYSVSIACCICRLVLV